jgi:deoxyribodipyrimidine photo-lyase
MLSDYPMPIIDLLASRNRALEAFKTLADVPRSIRPPVVDL